MVKEDTPKPADYSNPCDQTGGMSASMESGSDRQDQDQDADLFSRMFRSYRCHKRAYCGVCYTIWAGNKSHEEAAHHQIETGHMVRLEHYTET